MLFLVSANGAVFSLSSVIFLDQRSGIADLLLSESI